jgi:hypothetical protein
VRPGEHIALFFEIIGPILNRRVIARGRGVRSLRRLRKTYGGKTWRKMSGIASVRLANGNVRRAEVHWYEAHGIGSKDYKIKRILP